MTCTIYAGTSGFSYKEWKGPFYPADLKEADFLRFYSSQLNAVEINNTFYRMPKRDQLNAWANQTPAHFRFVIKASRRITHFKRLRDADEPMYYLLRSVEVLGDRLGALFFQLPPNLRCNPERLQKFVALIPDGVPAAMEFRHDSWFTEEVFDILRSTNIATCHVDDDGHAGSLPVTADWTYLRLRKPAYTKADLKAWGDTLAAQDLSSAMVFFKHETAGAGPLLAGDFMASLARRKKLKVARAA